DREDPHAVRPRLEPAQRPRADPQHPARIEPHALAADLALGGAAEHDVDLLLAVVRVVVRGVVREPRREVEHLHPERPDAELGGRELDEAAVDRGHPVDRPHRVAAHRPSPVAEPATPARSSVTHGSSPTTQASWPEPTTNASPGPSSSSVPSSMRTACRPEST